MLCDYGCGQEAKYQLKNKKWCCSKSQNSCSEVRRKNSGSNKGRLVSKNTREKMSKAKKGKSNHWLGKKRGPMNEEVKGKISEKLSGEKNYQFGKKNFRLIEWNKLHSGKNSYNFGKHRIRSEDSNRKQSESMKKIRNDPNSKYYSEDYLQKRKEFFKGDQNPSKRQGARKRLSEQTENLWRNSDFVKKQMKARGSEPNRLELFFQDWLNENFLNEWKYVGDGQLIIAGKCPDFVNINGKKQIIELYGDYWHRGDNPEDRIKIFEPFGYRTLVIWGSELKNLDRIKEKIIEFSGKKG